MRQCVHALGFLHLSCVRSRLVGGFSLKRSEGGEEGTLISAPPPWLRAAGGPRFLTLLQGVDLTWRHRPRVNTDRPRLVEELRALGDPRCSPGSPPRHGAVGPALSSPAPAAWG